VIRVSKGKDFLARKYITATNNRYWNDLAMVLARSALAQDNQWP
ncbi:uncharacterized protein METZ01_LOCUS92340, partial [marine metagenome]